MLVLSKMDRLVPRHWREAWLITNLLDQDSVTQSLAFWLWYYDGLLHLHGTAHKFKKEEHRERLDSGWDKAAFLRTSNSSWPVRRSLRSGKPLRCSKLSFHGISSMIMQSGSYFQWWGWVKRSWRRRQSRQWCCFWVPSYWGRENSEK